MTHRSLLLVMAALLAVAAGACSDTSGRPPLSPTPVYPAPAPTPTPAPAPAPAPTPAPAPAPAPGNVPRLVISFGESEVHLASKDEYCQASGHPCWKFRVTVKEVNGFGFSFVASPEEPWFEIGSVVINVYVDGLRPELGYRRSLFKSWDDCQRDPDPAKNRIPPKGEYCLNMTERPNNVTFASDGGILSQTIEYVFYGKSDDGQPLTFVSPRLRLSR